VHAGVMHAIRAKVDTRVSGPEMLRDAWIAGGKKVLR